MPTAQIAETRTDRRKRRNRQALIEAGYEVMAQKGIDAATMSESPTWPMSAPAPSTITSRPKMNWQCASWNRRWIAWRNASRR